MKELWGWISSDPLLAAATIGVALVTCWKALPAAVRVHFEQRYPRVVGVLRTLVALLPDVIGAARVVRYQTIEGQPRPIVSEAAVREAERLRELQREQPTPPRSEAGVIDVELLHFVAAAVIAYVIASIVGCSPTLPRDAYRVVGTGVAVTAAAGRELALVEARDCLDRQSATEARLCVAAWRDRWLPIAQSWRGAADRSQSLADVVRSVEAHLERRWPVDGGAP